jgi:hypothetical protein
MEISLGGSSGVIILYKRDSMNAPTWLLDYKKNVFSQSGEDGIIDKILDILPFSDHWCVEFGAWDGVRLSNTRHLILSKGFSAVLIEGDRRRFLELKNNYIQTEDRVIPIQSFVGFGDHDNLDEILEQTPIPQDFDLLSIDIDGNDYHVWKRVEHYQPKIVVVEFNPTIPTEVRFVQPADPSVNQGSSLLSFVELGKEKGYELICVLPLNAFFVRKEYFSLFQMESNEPQSLRTDLSAITYLFTGYDGRLFLRGASDLPWHGIRLNESSLQPLPLFFRRYSGNYTRFHKITFAAYLLYKEPSLFVHLVHRRLRRWLDRIV